MLQDVYSKLSDQEKKILYVTLGFIVLAVFDFLFLQPVSGKLKSLDKDIVQTKSDIKRNVRFLSYQDKILKEVEVYRALQSDEQKTEEEIIAAFLKTIENLGTEAEVVLGKLNPAEAVPKKGYIQYFANVECNGKLENIIKFIHKIDTTSNLLKVVKMNIIGKKASAEEVTVAIKISKLIIDTKSAAASGSAQDATATKTKEESLMGNLSNQKGSASAGLDSQGKRRGSLSEGQGSQTTDGSAVDNDNAINQGNAAGGQASDVGQSGGVGQASALEGQAAGGTGTGQAEQATSLGVSGAGGGGTSSKKVLKKTNMKSGSSASAGQGQEVIGQQGSESDAESGQSSDGQENKPGKEKDSKPTPFNKVTTGERVKIKSLESLWDSFWGGKSKTPNEQIPTESE